MSRRTDKFPEHDFTEGSSLNLHEQALAQLQSVLGEDDVPPAEKLRRALRVTASHRAQLIGNTLIHRGGLKVRGGPFADMLIPNHAAEGCFVPKLLGCYEAELHPVIDHIRARGYPNVVNIGCAEGYYAVGLARLLPNSRVWAYDTDENARKICASVAEQNGVRDRIKIAGTFGHDDFAGFPAGGTVVICDIEGAELDLLNPTKAPALMGFDIQVELHHKFDFPVNKALIDQFEDSHHIQRILPSTRDIAAFPELQNLEHLDQLLAFWEFRRGPNPWLFMSARNQ
ncbi:MAG: hypothetical protein OSB69_09430 [Alphaproteobacteria bacterium]|nr:hypothetical protein [Alphaproteobacteria bacterium]